MRYGDRIGAVLKADDGVVHFIGYGVYKGDEVPPDTIGGFNVGLPNPKLLMDNGVVVWGCECWWGPEEKIKNSLKRYDEVIIVNMDEARTL